MPRIFPFTSGPDDWRSLLADPSKHWKSGFSARTLAHCWEAADGFPTEVKAAFARSTDPLLANIAAVIGIPEFKVPLPGGSRASQNDIFVLARSAAGPVSVMVEGKVSESFGPMLQEWRTDSSAGKEERLAFLLRTLGLRTMPPGTIRYQLLHRAASALITAEQYRAIAAVMLIHSFSEERPQTGLADYRAFADLFGVSAKEGAVQLLSSESATPLFGAWVVGESNYLRC